MKVGACVWTIGPLTRSSSATDFHISTWYVG